MLRFSPLLLMVPLLTQASFSDDPELASQRETTQRETTQPAAVKAQFAEEKIEVYRAIQLFRKKQSGESLSAEEEAYLKRALEARRRKQRNGNRGTDGRALPTGDKTGLKPLDQMSANDSYMEQDGGLYGGGKNEPPKEHRQAALRELAKIKPLDKDGNEAADGKIVLVSISMSNATQEFSRFKQMADRDPDKSTNLTIVDCAQGGQAMAEWVSPNARPWTEAARRLAQAHIAPAQVQVAWIKLANKEPQGDLQTHGRKLESDTLSVIQNAKQKFKNLRIVYLASRIYGGYSGGSLNPEPYAYESAYPVRWLIQDQIAGNPKLNYQQADNKAVEAPLLLWGPYLWADGVTPRNSDGLTWNREDLGGDGTHPSQSGRDKVGRLLHSFFKTDPLAKSWFEKSKE